MYNSFYVKRGLSLALSLIAVVSLYFSPKANTAEAEIPIFDNEEDRYEYIFDEPRQLYRVSAPPKGYENASRAKSWRSITTSARPSMSRR